MKELTEEKDVKKLQGMVGTLWKYLDDIDTLDDACRSNDESFRNSTRKIQLKRHKVLTSDGYYLYVPCETIGK